MSARNAISYAGIGVSSITLAHDVSITYDSSKAHNSEQAGLAVKLVDADTVGLVDDNDVVYGKLDHVEPDGKCVVHIHGLHAFPKGNGASFSDGGRIVGDQGAGGAKGYVNGAPAVPGAFNQGTLQAVANGRGRCLNIDGTDVVWVDLDA